MSKGHVDAAAGGAFLSFIVANATTLIEKMVANQSWGEDRKTQKGMHSVKEADMLAAKIDLPVKRLDNRAGKKEAMKSTVQTMDSHMTCEICGDIGYSRNYCPETHEDVAYINNEF
jgi:hypothetical protein